jgi:UDP-N-acetylglucosamine 1-carboxyvinyltransferase
MEVLRIQGGTRLVGSLEAPGSKNAALALLSVVPMVDGVLELSNTPDVSDVRIKTDLLGEFGVKSTWREGTLFLDTTGLTFAEPSESVVRTSRTGFYLFGPLLARFGKAVLPMPGGCKIGARPVDFHIKGLRAMGASITMQNGCYIGSCKRLHGANIYLDFPSAGATQHIMATATLADGLTTIQNAAREPEVLQLADFLMAMGARIEGAGTSTITIYGDGLLKGVSHRVPSDRIQAGTFLLAAAITGGDVTVTGILPDQQVALLEKLREAEVEVQEGYDWVRVRGVGRPKPVRVKTVPYPGFPTDLQQPLSALLTLGQGSSVIEETIYEQRFGHVDELQRMGAKITTNGRYTFIDGVEKLTGASVVASDLRAGAALVLAGLAAEGETVVDNVHFIDRGYEDLVGNLSSIGATIARVNDPGRAVAP